MIKQLCFYFRVQFHCNQKSDSLLSNLQVSHKIKATKIFPAFRKPGLHISLKDSSIEYEGTDAFYNIIALLAL